MGTQMEMEVPMDMVAAHMVIVDQMGMETPQSMETHRGKDTPKEGGEVQMVIGNPMGMGVPQIEEEDLPEKMGIQMGEMEVLTLMIVGMRMILHPHQTPHCPEEEGIGDPNMFMYCKGLQGHQARKGNLDNLDRQEEMAEMGKPCMQVSPALRVQRTNFDTTGLENSFSQFGRTMSEVLKAQQRTNQNLEE